MLLPVLNLAREKAKTTYCAGNLRQLMLVTLEYANDFNGFLFPAPRLETWPLSFRDVLHRPKDVKILNCGSKNAKRRDNRAYYPLCSYARNSSFSQRKQTKVEKFTKSTVLYCDATFDNIGSDAANGADYWKSKITDCHDKGSANYLFPDGRIIKIPYSHMRLNLNGRIYFDPWSAKVGPMYK